MAELQIHHEVEVEHDPLGLRVGVQASLIAVVLAIINVSSIVPTPKQSCSRAAANDTWQRYQSSRVKLHGIEVGEDLVGLLPANPRREAMLAEYGKAKVKYDKQSD